MPETEKSYPSSKRGRRPFNPIAKQRDRVMLLTAGGLTEPAIAAVLGCCERTLRNCFKAELETGRGVKRAQNLERLEAAAKQGNVSAMKALEAIFGHAGPSSCRARARPRPVLRSGSLRPVRRPRRAAWGGATISLGRTGAGRRSSPLRAILPRGCGPLLVAELVARELDSFARELVDIPRIVRRVQLRRSNTIFTRPTRGRDPRASTRGA
jgi:hypothetical protein